MVLGCVWHTIDLVIPAICGHFTDTTAGLECRLDLFSTGLGALLLQVPWWEELQAIMMLPLTAFPVRLCYRRTTSHLED